ncbi:MAG: cupin domain-containing protein [Gammaproteobacteria bacterium]|nr:cupin domain-containing protein [Gammaproteobacteria bacterium]
MNLELSPLTLEQFLAQYWQQKPVLIKGGLIDFENPVEADELAGLAAESNIESRVIWKTSDGWQAQSGPFENYDEYGDKNWSLVVQSVNHWMPAAQDFARLFDFIPQWRFDDIMVSFAAPGGGVGPHVDNYDVFICQGSGQRHWKVGDKSQTKTVIAHEKLLHVEPFEPIIDEIVNAGDVLYIPPGFPHEGISIDESMSFSVGYKSTNATELLSGFADYLIDFDKKPALLCDAKRGKSRYGQIDTDDVQRLKSFLQETINSETKLANFIGLHHSQSLSELDLAQDEYDFDDWLSIFSNDTPLLKLYAVKSIYVEPTVEQGIFYLDGERHQLAIEPELIRKICDSDMITMSDVAHYPNSELLLQWLWQSTQRGYWYFDE